MKPWPWTRRWFEVKVAGGASQEQVDSAVAEIESAEKITHFSHSFGPDTPKDESKVDYPTVEEAYAISEDGKHSSIVRTIAFAYAYQLHMNAGLTKLALLELGKFGNADAFIFIRKAGYEGEGWRYKLTKLLRKWNLIEEFI